MVRICFWLVLVAGCVGCARTRYVPVREESVRVRTDTVFRWVRDSSVTASALRERERVEIRDSIAPVVDSTGMVVAYDRWHWRTTLSDTHDEKSSWRNRNDTASSTIIRTDTVVKEAMGKPNASGDRGNTRGLRWWQKVLMALGVIALIRALIRLIIFCRGKSLRFPG